MTTGLAIALILSLSRTSPPATPTLSRLAIPLPAAVLDTGRPVIALSPDGSQLAYVAEHGSTSLVYLRAIDGFEATPVAGTEGANSVFFSPDGEWIGFYGAGRVKKVSVHGGPPVTLASATDFMGATWGPNGTIVFALGGANALYEIRDAGSEPKKMTPAPDGAIAEVLPHLLPAGRAVLVNLVKGKEQQGSVALRILRSGDARILVPDGR